MQPFAEAAAELFNEDNPDVNITVGAAGTSGGFEKFCAGETDISDASRPIEPEEVDACKEGGVSYTDFQVANDGISVVTNPSLEISCLTTDQLEQLWVERRGHQLQPAGQRRRHRRSAARRRGQPLRPRHRLGHVRLLHRRRSTVRRASAARTTSRPRTTTCSSRASRGTQSGLGYFGFSYYEQNQDALNLVSVDGGDGCVAPSADTIQDGSYTPLSRPLFMYPSDGGAREAGGRRRSCSSSPTTTTQIAEAALIVPMDSEQGSKAQAAVAEGGRLRPLEGPPADTGAHGGSRHSGGRRGRRGREPSASAAAAGARRLIRALLFLAAAISVLTTILIVVALLKESIPFFKDVGAAFFSDAEWSPLFSDPEFGIRQLLIGTFLVTGIAIVVAVPIGIGSAIYLSEYASPRTRRIVKPILEVLVGVPTIVFGYFALTFITPTILQDILHLDVQVFNALAAGLIMGFMIVPTIASISEDAMSAVPQGLREGAYGLGATKRQVATKVVFPAAISGIVASIVLGISRGVGETMIVLIAAGLAPSSSLNPLEPHATITAFMGATAKGDNPAGTIGYQSIFACGLTLFVLTLLMNMVAIRFVRKYREVYE